MPARPMTCWSRPRGDFASSWHQPGPQPWRCSPASFRRPPARRTRPGAPPGTSTPRSATTASPTPTAWRPPIRARPSARRASCWAARGVRAAPAARPGACDWRVRWEPTCGARAWMRTGACATDAASIACGPRRALPAGSIARAPTMPWPATRGRADSTCLRSLGPAPRGRASWRAGWPRRGTRSPRRLSRTSRKRASASACARAGRPGNRGASR
jgi:hypothetical protein